MEKKQRKKLELTKFGMYKLFLASVVGVLLLHFIITLWWVPRRDAGSPVLGDRMEGIEQLEESWIQETEGFGNDHSNVYNFSIFWNSGPVVYFNVEVNEGVSLGDARSAAGDIVTYFIDLSDGVAEDYNLQVAISRAGDDLAELRDANHAAVREHALEHQHGFVEEILAHAEQYPTANNANRAYNHLRQFGNIIIEVAGEEELESMWERHGSIVELTAEQEDQLAEDLGRPVPAAGEDRRVPSTDFSTFPNFGVWDHDRGRINWN